MATLHVLRVFCDEAGRRGNPLGVFLDASAALGCEDIDAVLHAMGRSIGPPWQVKHKLAAAAAVAAAAHGKA